MRNRCEDKKQGTTSGSDVEETVTIKLLFCQEVSGYRLSKIFPPAAFNKTKKQVGERPF